MAIRQEGFAGSGIATPTSPVGLLRKLKASDSCCVVNDWYRPMDCSFIEQSLPHGHVQTVLGTIRTLPLDRLLDSRSCRQRNLVVAMIAAQLLHHSSKIADTRLWHPATLAQQLGVAGTDENEFYQVLACEAAAMHRGQAGQATPPGGWKRLL